MILVLQTCVHQEVHLGITQRQKWLSAVHRTRFELFVLFGVRGLIDGNESKYNYLLSKIHLKTARKENHKVRVCIKAAVFT